AIPPVAPPDPPPFQLPTMTPSFQQPAATRVAAATSAIRPRRTIFRVSPPSVRVYRTRETDRFERPISEAARQREQPAAAATAGRAAGAGASGRCCEQDKASLCSGALAQCSQPRLPPRGRQLAKIR